jgi:hypothetical protein
LKQYGDVNDFVFFSNKVLQHHLHLHLRYQLGVNQVLFEKIFYFDFLRQLLAMKMMMMMWVLVFLLLPVSYFDY